MLTAKTQYNLQNAREYFEEHLCVGDYYDEGQRVPISKSGRLSPAADFPYFQTKKCHLHRTPSFASIQMFRKICGQNNLTTDLRLRLLSDTKQVILAHTERSRSRLILKSKSEFAVESSMESADESEP